MTLNKLNTQKFLQPGCFNPCLSCESIIYNLKFFNNNDCTSNECFDVCNNIINQYNTNQNILMFLNNQISTCETCARIGLCNMNDCNYQTNGISESIMQTLSRVATFHLINNPINNVIQNITTDIVNYENLNKIYNYSEKLSQLYMSLYKKVIGSEYRKVKLNKFSAKKSNKLLEQYKGEIEKLDQFSTSNLV